jgi:hypothetical protein
MQEEIMIDRLGMFSNNKGQGASEYAALSIVAAVIGGIMTAAIRRLVSGRAHTIQGFFNGL